MSVNLELCYSVAVKAVKEVGVMIRSAIYCRDKNVETKSSEVDLVTITDQKVEKYLINAISEQFPNHNFIGEESVAGGARVILTNDPTWIIDPIDGTMNFVHGFPNTCTSIGLLVNKEPILGIVYNPVLELMFEARKGQGATLNGSPISVSNQTELSKALIGFEFGTSRDPEKCRVVKENINKLVLKVHGVRSLGSAALNMAYVAMGALDAEFEFGLHAWDMAAGWLIVTEANGVVIDPAGGDFNILSRRVLCAGTRELAHELSKELVQFYPEED